MLLPARLRREIVLPALLFALVALAACAPAPSPTSAPAPARAQPTQAASTPTPNPNPTPNPTPTPDPTPTPAPTQTPSILTVESARAAFARQNPDREPPQVARIIDAAGVWVAVGDAGQAVMYVDEANQWQTPNRLETEAGPAAYRLVQGRLELWNPLTLAFQAMALEGEMQSVTVQGSSVRVELADGTSKLLQFDEKSRQWEELTIYREFEAKELTPDEYQETVNIALAGGKFINTDAEWQELTEGKEDQPGWRVVEDASSHTPVLVSPEAAQMIEAQYGGEFSASPWAEIFAQTRGSMWEGKFKTNSRTPTVAIFDSAGKPALLVSLEKSNPLGKETVAVVLTAAGEVKEIPVPFVTPFRKMFARWDKDLGRPVLTDEYETATHEWDDQQKQWVELKEYKVYGTARERLAQALRYKVFEEKREVDRMVHQNVFGLDKEKVQAVIDALKTDKSIAEINANEAKAAGIYILTDAEGEPALVVIRGGEYGLNEKQLESLLRALVEAEQADSGIIKFLAEQFGAKFISMGTTFASVEGKSIAFSSNDLHDTIIAKPDNPDSILVRYWLNVIVVESGEIMGGRHMIGGANGWQLAGKISEYDNFGHFAMSWALDWFNNYGTELVGQEVISQSDLNKIIGGIKYGLDQYKNPN